MTSQYDPSRDTVGKIYRDAQINNTEHSVINGDLTHELMQSLSDDLNKTIQSNPYQGRDFYITVHEKKDLQMPRAILRRLITTVYRPWPEDDTIAFKVYQSAGQVRFCWCLPHWSEMDNMLSNYMLFDPEMVQQIRYWKNFELGAFGFIKDQMGNWVENLDWDKDKPLGTFNQGIRILTA